MYHARIEPEERHDIVLNSTIRVLFAFGMGVDIRLVVHYGPTNDIEDYVQETYMIHSGLLLCKCTSA